jgi:DNA-binding protein H-NS
MAQTIGDIEQFDFESLSDGQLSALQSRIREIINRRVQSRLDEFRLMAQEVGFEMSFSKIGEEPARRRGRPRGDNRGQRRGPLPPQYRNPDNPAETWSGRGHRPRWLLSQLEAGKSLSDLRIDHQPTLQHADETGSEG